MTPVPPLVCPRCGRPLEYHVTIEIQDPPIGKIDIGYCPTCAMLQERIRETGTYYDSTLWPPVCRTCHQPVTFAGVSAADIDVATYRCREHPRERWIWNMTAERWVRDE